VWALVFVAMLRHIVLTLWLDRDVTSGVDAVSGAPLEVEGD
jgi:hypothetical protein